MTVRKLEKLPRGKVTVNDILNRADINEALRLVNEASKDIEEIIVITQEKDGFTHWRCGDMPDSRIIYLLEVTKNAILNGASEE